jgi:8-oxo-dGTP diphosphatase
MLVACARRSSSRVLRSTSQIKTMTARTRSVQGTYTYEWPRPAVTVDAILVSKESPSKVLLIQRKQDPFSGSWALPGGFVDEMEPLHHAAARELQEETSVDPSELGEFIQIGAYGNPGRDPRGWTVGVAFATFANSSIAMKVKAADDAAAVQWYEIENLPQLAFDHGDMLRDTFYMLSKEEEVEAVAGLREQLQRAAAKLA